MTVTAAFFLICLTITVTYADKECQNVVSCPCGDTGENVTICADVDTEICTRLSKCKMCEEGSDVCSECPEGFEGPLCSQAILEYCENPRPISNGKSRFHHPTINVGQEMKFFPLETVREYSCDEGYRLEGSNSSTCKGCPSCKTAKWHQRSEPQCITDCGRGFLNYGPCSLTKCNRHAPWVVSISVENGDEVRHVCLGVLLNYQTVLTAAHCLVGHKHFLIQFGKHGSRFQKDNPHVIVRRSSRIIVHPDFSNTTFDSNIGLLVFEPKIRFTADTQPICMRTYWEMYELTKIGNTGIVSVTSGIANAYPEGKMDLARMTVLDDKSCLEANKQAELFITKNSFCAGKEYGIQSVCAGDSGTPLFSYGRQEGRFLLQGIASFPAKDSCHMPGNYAVFTKLPEFLSWIHENLK